MGRVAQFLPYIYEAQLHYLKVPGYEGYPEGAVSLTKYMSANTMFGGASRAGYLKQVLAKACDASERQFLNTPAGIRVFTGQGMPDDVIRVLGMVNQYRSALAQDRTLAPFFKEKDFLQALCDATYFGLDCIGFVGTYCAVSGIDPTYVGRRPLDFAGVFKPVKSLSEVNSLSVVMLTNGMHVQIVDWVWERFADHIIIDLCQSSGMDGKPASTGPQTNVRVRIDSGGGSYLPVEEFRAAKSSKSKWSDYAAQEKGTPNDNGYEMYLRRVMTIQHQQYGYMGGAIFQIRANGEPQNPVGGSVYIGTMPDIRLAGD